MNIATASWRKTNMRKIVMFTGICLFWGVAGARADQVTLKMGIV
jgi:hypothetical protein